MEDKKTKRRKEKISDLLRIPVKTFYSGETSEWQNILIHICMSRALDSLQYLFSVVCFEYRWMNKIFLVADDQFRG